VQLLETGKPPDQGVTNLLNDNLGRFFARVAQNLVRESGMEMRDIRAIGSHGQNVWHQPRGENPVSMQLGRGDLIAKNTGTTVVCNFRGADVNAGGQGAPLAPLLHQHLFRTENENRAILNIGGIANLTLLPALGGIAGFDSGPGNCLMDAWSRIHLHKDYDDKGSWARKGRVNTILLETLLRDSYFSLPSPKSTGLEHFNTKWLNQALSDFDIEPVDVQTTLTELTAISVAKSLRDFSAVRRLLVCGGGVHNNYLMRRIAAALPDAVVEPTTRHGADPDWVEGLLFAWLARERLNEVPQDTCLITGSQRPVLLGDIYEP
jgi:anhydro-N-acetylmuramic acid kinase